MTLIYVDKVLPNPKQPRTQFDKEKLEELARSIDENGLLEPIVVEDNLDGTFTLVAGERRLRAVKLLKRDGIEATVRKSTNHNGRERLIHAMVENIQREDMSPIDEAKAYQALQQDYGMTQSEVSQVTGKAVAHINNFLTLLKLDQPIQDLIAKGKFSKDSGLAREMLRIPSVQARIKLAQRIVDTRMTIPAAKAMAVKLTETLQAEPLDKNAVPALEMARRKTAQDVSMEKAPARWSAIQELRVVPPWGIVAKNASDTCFYCALRSVASHATCGPCPLTDHLRRLMEAAK